MLKLHKTVLPPPLLKQLVCVAKADSGASAHFWRPQDAKILTNIHNETGPPVKLPDATTINDTQVGYPPLSNLLSAKAKKARILSDLKSSSFISIGQLADDGCQTTIDKEKLTIKKNDEVILTGIRNTYDDLYDIPIYRTHPNPKYSITKNNFVMPDTHGIYHTVMNPKQYSNNWYVTSFVKRPATKNKCHVDNISL